MVLDRDKKTVVADMKPIYQANNEQQGYEKLLEFEEKWGKKYPFEQQILPGQLAQPLCLFRIRPSDQEDYLHDKPTEEVHRQICKITKSKGAFSSEQALMKLMYLVIKNISKKWTMPIHNWGLAFSQLFIEFGDRILKEHNSF